MKLLYFFLLFILFNFTFSLASHLTSSVKKSEENLANLDDPPVVTSNSDTTSSSSSSSSGSSTTITTTTTTTSTSSSSSTADPAESGLYATILKTPGWVYAGDNCKQKKKNYSQMTKIPGNASLRVQKKDIMNQRIFSQGESAPICLILEAFLLESFKTETTSAYANFKGADSVIMPANIKKGMGTNHWQIQGSLDDLSDFLYQTYNTDGSDGLSDKEFAFLTLDNVFSYAVNYECQNCLKDIRWEISKLFEFLDYDLNGYVQAVDLFEVFKRMNKGDDLKTVNVNAWLLDEDIKQIGRLGLEQFTEAILRSLYERRYL